MSETNKDIAVAFYKKALFEGRVEDAFRLYAVPTYRQHNPLIEDGMEGVKKFVTWIMSNHPDARGEIKRVFADVSGCAMAE
jgi:predicted SnoaL-like aldol condensation-catalyzing enzyme